MSDETSTLEGSFEIYRALCAYTGLFPPTQGSFRIHRALSARRGLFSNMEDLFLWATNIGLFWETINDERTLKRETERLVPDWRALWREFKPVEDIALLRIWILRERSAVELNKWSLIIGLFCGNPNLSNTGLIGEYSPKSPVFYRFTFPQKRSTERSLNRRTQRLFSTMELNDYSRISVLFSRNLDL